MKILFIFPKWTSSYGLFGHFARRSSTWQPLNLALMAAVAQRAGHTAKIIDAQAENLSNPQIIKIVKEYRPDLIGMTGTTPFYHLSVALAWEIKAAFYVPICIGGPHITIMQEKAFDQCFDYAFLGEAEETFERFLMWLDFPIVFPLYKGIMYRHKGEVINTGLADPIAGLDSLPTPARHLLPMHKYKIGTPRGTKKFATIMTTRGCPFECVFCNTSLTGHNVRRRSIPNVIKEIMGIIRDFNITHFIFIDDTFTLTRAYALELCYRLKSLNITFSCSTRADLVNPYLIKLMAEAGLIRISFGLETVDEVIRRNIKKTVPLEAYKTANRLTNEFGIETLNSLMIGLPGETKQTYEKTMKFLDESKEIKQANLAIAVPYPGTELYKMAQAGDYGLRILTHDFSQYRRYNSAVMESDTLSSQDLLSLQNEGFIRIYSKPWRWLPMLRKNGIIGLLLMLVRLIKRRGRCMN